MRSIAHRVSMIAVIRIWTGSDLANLGWYMR
jgi:hypothetical protein